MIINMNLNKNNILNSGFEVRDGHQLRNLSLVVSKITAYFPNV